jgi:hypothetical protein
MVTDFSTQYAGAVGTSTSVEVWTRPGAYAGFTTSSAGWTLTQTVTAIAAGTTTNAPATLTTPIDIPFGSTTSIYFHSITSASGIRYFGTGTTSNTMFSNADVMLFSDISRTGAVAFAGSQFTPRAFVGNLTYTTVVPEPTFCLVGLALVGAGYAGRKIRKPNV